MIRSSRRNLSTVAQGVPIIDVSELVPGNDARLSLDMSVCREIRDACAEWGFFQATKAPIDSDLLERFYKAKEAFFYMEKEKKESVRRDSKNSKGWYDDELTKQRVDWKEGFDIGAQNGSLDKYGLDGENQWPREKDFPEIDGFQDVIREYYAACEKFARSLTCAMTVGLNLPPEALVRPYFDGSHSSYLRLNFYPTCPKPEDHFAISHHTDAGAVTVLTQSPVQSLQVFQPEDETWYDVAPMEGAFVINTGDVMQVWSNDRYKAPLHRVKAQLSDERFSSPFFYNPSYETNYAPVETCVDSSDPARYAPINWGEFRLKRFAGDFADVGEDVQISHYRSAPSSENRPCE
eukprot:g1992.t1